VQSDPAAAAVGTRDAGRAPVADVTYRGWELHDTRADADGRNVRSGTPDALLHQIDGKRAFRIPVPLRTARRFRANDCAPAASDPAIRELAKYLQSI